MNRFRTKKNKDESSPRPSQDSEFAMPSFRGFKKAKKPVEETPQIDIAAALPTNDDFRTSLLMSGLSARFSMLREQDDPGSKIGKASDDSVLFPNRHSRLDFGMSRDLGDIAEVESMKPPYGRQESFISSDDAASITGGSIMGRSRQTEGNNLFGGRQKIYKIPAGASSKSSAVGGMPGRALYDDDVAMSAFQRWRMGEKGRKSTEGESDGNDEDLQDDLDADMPRSVSPAMPGYNRNRDTSSTMSSIPSMARNSTAATSIISNQRTPSFKENQSGLPTSNTTNSTPAPVSTVTRTRRLYEQALNQDLQENQSSALSRFESISRQRALGSRTPDVGQAMVPSPTLSVYSERLGGGRSVLAKASAPNLRSMSPPASATSLGTPDLGYRTPGQSENRAFLSGGAPPLSPPISESEDTSMLPIQPNDRGKATALGVFQKPSQGYDESRFAQRQLQLQQGRDTPTNRDRTDSAASAGSSTPAVTQRSTSGTKPASSKVNQHPLHEEQSTFFMDDDASEISVRSPEIDQSAVMAQHPAFRPSTEQAASSTSSPSTQDEATPQAAVDEKGDPLDSPTLGPGAGLSGMVRQHLRAVSNTSSVYTADAGMPESDNEDDARELPREQHSHWSQERSVPGLDHVRSNPSGGFMSINDFDDAVADSLPRESLDRDDFASQLADGARRVRERLTLYQDNDSRSTSPYPVPESKESMDAGSSSKVTGLGILRSKDSRGSMRERGRDESQSKAMRMLGLGSRGTSPAGMKYPTDSSPPLQPVQSIAETEEPRPTSEGSNKSATKEEHAGLRAFRQARRELQRMKELEAQNRHHPGQEPHASPPRSSGPNVMPEMDRGMPVRRPFDEPSRQVYTSGSRSTSRSDRDRSGSESSNGQRSRSRQGRFRQNSDVDHAPSPRADGLRPQVRIPGAGLPTSPHPMNRSPMGFQQQHPGSPSRLPQNHPGQGNLHPGNSRGYASGQPSPISPMPSPFMSSGQNTPNGWDRDGRSENRMPRQRPREPSDPHLRERPSHGNMPRMNGTSPSHAPPLPPINPRRRQESSRESSRTRTMYDSPGRHPDDKHGPVSSVSTPDLLRHADQSRDGSLMGRRPGPQKFTPPDFSARPRDNTPPFNVGPPASRMVVAPSRNPSNGHPGGMI